MASLNLHQEGAGRAEAQVNGTTAVLFVPGTFAFDDSYPTGGEAFDLSDILASVAGVLVSAQGGRTFEVADGSIIAYEAATDVEVADEEDLDGVVVSFVAWGRPA